MMWVSHDLHQLDASAKQSVRLVTSTGSPPPPSRFLASGYNVGLIAVAGVSVFIVVVVIIHCLAARVAEKERQKDLESQWNDAMFNELQKDLGKGFHGPRQPLAQDEVMAELIF